MPSVRMFAGAARHRDAAGAQAGGRASWRTRKLAQCQVGGRTGAARDFPGAVRAPRGRGPRRRGGALLRLAIASRCWYKPAKTKRWGPSPFSAPPVSLLFCFVALVLLCTIPPASSNAATHRPARARTSRGSDGNRAGGKHAGAWRRRAAPGGRWRRRCFAGARRSRGCDARAIQDM